MKTRTAPTVRLACGIAATFMLLAVPARAEIRLERYLDLSKVSCEDSQTIADMEEIWGTLRTSSGSIMSNDRATVLSSKSRTKSSNKLSCSVQVQTSQRGTQRGLFVLTVWSPENWEVKFIPNY